MTRARGHVGFPSKAKPADTLINIRCSEHVTFRCDRGDRWPDVQRTIDLHTRDPQCFRVSYPTYSLPDRVPLRLFFPVVAVFGNACYVTKKRNHLWRVSPTLGRASRLGARDAHLSGRFFVRLGPIFQSPPGINDRKDGANNTGTDVYTGWGEGKGSAGYCRRAEYTAVYCRTNVSRTRRRRFEPPRFNQKVS